MAVALSSLTSLIGFLRAEVTTRRQQDNLIFARLKEDQDFAFNKNREDRFTVTGLHVTSPPPRDALERKEFFKSLLTSLILEACPDLEPQPKILDVYVNLRYGRGAPFIEARLDSVEASSAFRVSAAKLAKDEVPSFQGLFVANSVTLTTRVRIEILKALAKRLTTATEQAFVQSFSSRPMLHYQSLSHVLHPSSGTNRSYSFVEAVGRWGDRLTTVELLPAYRRARPAFIGCLEQYFIVLKESEPRDEGSSGFEQMFGSQPYPSSSWPGPSGSRNYDSRRPHRGQRGQSFRGGRPARPAFRTDFQVPSHSRKRLASQDGPSTPSKKKENTTENDHENEHVSSNEKTGETCSTDYQNMDQ
jgi:hypothetical protein